MYVIATIIVDGPDGEHEEYEVGGDVSYEPDGMFQGHEVGEPDISAPNVALKLSRIVDESTLPDGWSETVQEALVEAYEGRIGAALEDAADFYYDTMREDEL